VLAHAWDIRFFVERWAEAGLERGDVQGLEDLPKLPIYNSDDLKDAIAKDPPFGTHHPVGELGRIPIKIQTSGGTTGLPRVSLFDPIAWEVQAIQGARGMWAQGMRPGDIAQIPLTCSLANAAWLMYKACHDWLGVVPVTTGSGVVTSTEKQLEYAKAWGVNAWIASAEYLARVVEVAEQTHFDLSSLKTKLVHSYIGNDPLGSRRKSLEEAFGAPVYDEYGTHEVGEIAAECVHQNGLHIYEDTVFLEVLDVVTRKPVEPGQEGTLVATSLHRTCPPIIRYDLRDVLSLHERSHCECGLVTAKLSSFQRRADEMVKVRDQNVFPRAVEVVINDDPRTTGQYLCVATSRGAGPLKVTELTVRVERRGSYVDGESFTADLVPAFKRVLGVRVSVEVVEAGTLAPLTGYGGEGKIKRLLDLR
jgi:phenylacetate-CoA ligase